MFPDHNHGWAIQIIEVLIGLITNHDPKIKWLHKESIIIPILIDIDVEKISKVQNCNSSNFIGSIDELLGEITL